MDVFVLKSIIKINEHLDQKFFIYTKLYQIKFVNFYFLYSVVFIAEKTGVLKKSTLFYRC